MWLISPSGVFLFFACKEAGCRSSLSKLGTDGQNLYFFPLLLGTLEYREKWRKLIPLLSVIHILSP